MLRRFEKVVLPEEDGPEIIIKRLSGCRSFIISAIRAICFSCIASDTFIILYTVESEAILLKSPTLLSPNVLFHFVKSLKISNIFC